MTSSLALHTLRPIQAAVAAMFFRYRKIMVKLPRQFGGKTELGVRLLHDITARNSTSSSLFVAKNASARRKATREKFLRIFDPKMFAINTEIIYNRKHPTSQINMASIDKDPGAQRGGTVNVIHWSEVAFAKIDLGETIPDTWEKIFRPMLSQTNGYAYLESTTNGKNGFYDLWENAEKLGFRRFSCSLSQMLEMGLITQEDYDKEKRETHPLFFAQEYECEWVTFRGLAYSEFKESVHVRDIAGPAEWMRPVFALDWGWDPSATCALFGYMHDEVLHVFDEIYEKRQLVEDTAEALNARRSVWGLNTVAGVGDHEGDRNAELMLRGISIMPADKVNVLGNRLQIKEMLWKGTILIHPRCEFLIKDLKAATWHDKKEGDLDYKSCTWGHYDAEAALRYLVRAFKDYEEQEPEENPHIGIDETSGRAWQLARNNGLETD